MSARDRVTSRIADQARRYPEFDLSSLDISGLDDRDAALARAMEMATLRRWLTLVTILDFKLNQPWEGRGRHITGRGIRAGFPGAWERGALLRASVRGRLPRRGVSRLGRGMMDRGEPHPTP